MASAYNGDLAGFAQIIGGLCPLSRPHGLRVISLTNKQTDTHTHKQTLLKTMPPSLNTIAVRILNIIHRPTTMKISTFIPVSYHNHITADKVLFKERY